MTNIQTIDYIGKEVSLQQVLRDTGIEASTPSICHCGKVVNDIEERIFFENVGECYSCDHIRGDFIGSESEEV